MLPLSVPEHRLHKPTVKPALANRGRAGLAKWLFVALVAIVALSMQLRAFPNHDVAWVLWGAREMLGGAIWGRDIIEPNPPLAWYLGMPSAWLATILGTPIAATFHVMVAGAALCSVAAFDMLVRADSQERRSQRYLPTLVAALFLLLLPYRDFGQREHLMLIAALPYVALAALRGSDGVQVPRATALAIGVVAGVGFALKPHFLAVPLFVEIATMVALRRWTSVFRPETIAIAAVVAAYGFFVLVFVPDYLAVVVPMAREIYWSFDVPIARVVALLILPVVAMALTATMLRSSPQRLPLVLLAATAGLLLSCLLQSKAYSYHMLPVTAGAAIALAAALHDPRLSARLRVAAAMMLVILLFQPLVQTGQWWRLNGPGGAKSLAQNRLINAIDRHAGDGRFLVVAVHPFPAFPTALYAAGDQVSRTNSQWFLPAVVQLRHGTGAREASTLAFAERNAREFILRDLNGAPKLVIIDTDSARHTVSPKDIDFLAFYWEDARFRRAWTPYREVEPLGGYRLFVRSGGQDQ